MGTTHGDLCAFPRLSPYIQVLRKESSKKRLYSVNLSLTVFDTTKSNSKGRCAHFPVSVVFI
jgi:hypothetical protein